MSGRGRLRVGVGELLVWGNSDALPSWMEDIRGRGGRWLVILSCKLSCCIALEEGRGGGVFVLGGLLVGFIENSRTGDANL